MSVFPSDSKWFRPFPTGDSQHQQQVHPIESYRLNISEKTDSKKEENWWIKAGFDLIILLDINERPVCFKNLAALPLAWGWGCGQSRFKCGTLATPYPHYAAQLFHEQHLQNKFGIQICWGWSNNTKTLSLFLPRIRQREKEGGKKISISPFRMRWISHSAGSKLHFIDFIPLISQSVFNWHRKHGRANWLGSTNL